jgi:hypothetical protein
MKNIKKLISWSVILLTSINSGVVMGMERISPRNGEEEKKEERVMYEEKKEVNEIEHAKMMERRKKTEKRMNFRLLTLKKK